MDIGPLRRHRDYRFLFAGQALSFFGSMVTYVAVPYQVFQLTGSSLAVGLLSLAALGVISEQLAEIASSLHSIRNSTHTLKEKAR